MVSQTDHHPLGMSPGERATGECELPETLITSPRIGSRSISSTISIDTWRILKQREALVEAPGIQGNLLIWNEDSETTRGLRRRIISAADILELPPILSQELSSRFLAFLATSSMIQLFRAHQLSIPDKLARQCHQLKQTIESIWGKCREDFLDSRSKFLVSKRNHSKPDPSIRIFVVPFANLMQVQARIACLKQKAILKAQRQFNDQVLSGLGALEVIKSQALRLSSTNVNLPSPPILGSRSGAISATVLNEKIGGAELESPSDSSDSMSPEILIRPLPSTSLEPPAESIESPLTLEPRDALCISPMVNSVFPAAEIAPLASRNSTFSSVPTVPVGSQSGIATTVDQCNRPLSEISSRSHQSLANPHSSHLQLNPSSEQAHHPLTLQPSALPAQPFQHQPHQPTSPGFVLMNHSIWQPLEVSSSPIQHHPIATSGSVNSLDLRPLAASSAHPSTPIVMTELQMQAYHSNQKATLERNYYERLKSLENQVNTFLARETNAIKLQHIHHVKAGQLRGLSEHYNHLMMQMTAKHEAEANAMRRARAARASIPPQHFLRASPLGVGNLTQVMPKTNVSPPVTGPLSTQVPSNTAPASCYIQGSASLDAIATPDGKAFVRPHGSLDLVARDHPMVRPSDSARPLHAFVSEISPHDSSPGEFNEGSISRKRTISSLSSTASHEEVLSGRRLAVTSLSSSPMMIPTPTGQEANKKPRNEERMSRLLEVARSLDIDWTRGSSSMDIKPAIVSPLSSVDKHSQDLGRALAHGLESKSNPGRTRDNLHDEDEVVEIESFPKQQCPNTKNDSQGSLAGSVPSAINLDRDLDLQSIQATSLEATHHSRPDPTQEKVHKSCDQIVAIDPLAQDEANETSLFQDLRSKTIEPAESVGENQLVENRPVHQSNVYLPVPRSHSSSSSSSSSGQIITIQNQSSSQTFESVNDRSEILRPKSVLPESNDPTENGGDEPIPPQVSINPTTTTPPVPLSESMLGIYDGLQRLNDSSYPEEAAAWNNALSEVPSSAVKTAGNGQSSNDGRSNVDQPDASRAKLFNASENQVEISNGNGSQGLIIHRLGLEAFQSDRTFEKTDFREQTNEIRPSSPEVRSIDFSPAAPTRSETTIGRDHLTPRDDQVGISDELSHSSIPAINLKAPMVKTLYHRPSMLASPGCPDALQPEPATLSEDQTATVEGQYSSPDLMTPEPPSRNFQLEPLTGSEDGGKQVNSEPSPGVVTMHRFTSETSDIVLGSDDPSYTGDVDNLEDHEPKVIELKLQTDDRTLENNAPSIKQARKASDLESSSPDRRSVIPNRSCESPSGSSDSQKKSEFSDDESMAHDELDPCNDFVFDLTCDDRVSKDRNRERSDDDREDGWLTLI